MENKAAISADYCDFRVVKTRKVIQVVLEIPMEAGDAFIAAFGLPRPEGVPVALARLTTSASESDPPPIRPKGGVLAQKAGILCNTPAFSQFLAERHGVILSDAYRAADYLRGFCGIESRAELDHSREAALAFSTIVNEYDAWRNHG